MTPVTEEVRRLLPDGTPLARLLAAATPDVGVYDKAFVAQRADVAQNRSARNASLGRELVNRRGSVAAKAAHNGVMSESDVHPGTLARMVTEFGTV